MPQILILIGRDWEQYVLAQFEGYFCSSFI